MATGGEKGLARKVLSQRGRGSGVSNDLAASARRVLDGQAQSGDMEAIRQYFNVGRSHAGSIRRTTGMATRWAGTALNVSRDLDMAGAGSSAAGARAVVQIGLTAADEIVKNRRTLIKVGEGVARAVGADPALASRFLNSLSRIAKVGGAVGAGALILYEAGSAITRTMQAAADTGREARLMGAALLNRRQDAAIEARARREASGEKFFGRATEGDSLLGGGILDPLEWWNDWVDAAERKNVAEKQKRLLARTRRNRHAVSDVAGEAIGALAAKKGVAMQDLTPMDVNEAMDELAKSRINYTLDEYKTHGRAKMNEFTATDAFMYATSGSFRATKQNLWADELEERASERAANRVEARAIAEMEATRHRSPTDRLKLIRERDQATADFAVYRTNRKAIILD
jgi:hypothetical protein